MAIDRKEYQKEWQKKYRQSEKGKNYYKNYYIKNKEKHKELCKKNYNKDIKKSREKSRKYYYENKKRINDYRKNKIKQDKNFRLRGIISNRVRKVIYNEKNIYTAKGIINYKKIIEHLKPFPNKIEDYDVDHIIPLSSFDLTDPIQVEIAFHPSNHQWLLRKDNQKKQDKMISKDNQVINGREIRELSLPDKLKVLELFC